MLALAVGQHLDHESGETVSALQRVVRAARTAPDLLEFR